MRNARQEEKQCQLCLLYNDVDVDRTLTVRNWASRLGAVSADLLLSVLIVVRVLYCPCFFLVTNFFDILKILRPSKAEQQQTEDGQIKR
jgi:hypothetical protein